MNELEIVPQQQVTGLRIFINKVEYRSPHFHPEWELLWVLDTPLSITCARQQYMIQPGELILFPPNFPHEFHKMERPCTFLCLQISPRPYSTIGNVHIDDIRLKEYLSQENFNWLRKTILDTARAYWQQEDFYNLYCIGQCGLIMHRLLTQIPCHHMSAEEAADAEQRNARLMRLIQFVDENYMHKIKLSDFAEKEGRSVSYMSHFIHETMNQTFQDYVNSVRFNCARKLIAEGNKSMLSVSIESGFSDYRYFSRAFQKTYGMTPAHYSHQTQHNLPEHIMPVRNLHSLEQIYTNCQSMHILKDFQAQIETLEA